MVKKLCPPPKPQTIRGKSAYYFLKNLPGLLFIFILFAIALIGGEIIENKKSRLAEELETKVASEAVAINVITLTVHPATLKDKINLPGRIEPWIRLELAARVSGKVEEVFVQKGDQVKKGQLLTRIESKDYRIALDSAKAAYSLAKADFIRSETMHAKRVVPQAVLDARRAAMAIARAAMAAAEIDLARCRVIAPMSGIISRLDAKGGLFLNVADPVAEILEIDRVKAVIGIPESVVNAVKRLTVVEITIPAVDDEKITAPINFLASSPQPLAHVYRLELSVDNPEQKILPGMFIRASIVKTVNREAIAVPLYSVIAKDNTHFVYIEENGKAIKREVEPGFLDGWQVLVSSGLKVGENVIVKGHRTVTDGQDVRVIKSVKTMTELMP
jgi:membrane fusion protein (multidrug efflux system)